MYPFRQSPGTGKRPFHVVATAEEALVVPDLKEVLEEQGYEVFGAAGDARVRSIWPSANGRTWWS